VSYTTKEQYELAEDVNELNELAEKIIEKFKPCANFNQILVELNLEDEIETIQKQINKENVLFSPRKNLFENILK